MVERLRRDALAHVDQVRQLDHAAVARAHVAVADVAGGGTIDRRHLHDHVVLLAVLLEARHLAAAEHGLQRAADRVDRGADVGELVAVDGHAQLGRVEAKVRLQVLDARILARLVEKAIDHALQLRVRHLRHDHVFDRRRAKRLAQRRRIDRERERAGNRPQLRPQLVGDLLLPLGALLPGLQSQHRDAVDHRRESGDRDIGAGFPGSARTAPRSA